MVAALFHAARSWTGAKAIALLATIAFAVGIGATTAIYTVVNAVMLTPLPYEHGDRFVALYGARFSEPKQFSSNTLSDLQEYQQRTTSFDVFGWFSLGESNLSAPGEPRHVNVVSVMPALAHNLGVAPVIGRWFTDENGAVISYRLWRRLNADPTIVGRSMTLDGRALTLTGVMPPPFRLPVSGPGGEGFDTDVWLYLDPHGRRANSVGAFYFAYARRRPGVSLGQAEADVRRAAAEIARLDPASHPSYTARLLDLREGIVREIRPTLLLLFGAAGLLLVIACANVAGLLLARSVARARETATRVALGISQRQLALHYFAEGLLVSLAGVVAGVATSVWLVRLVIAIGSEFVPHADTIAMDWSVLAFALGLAVVTSAVCSVAPLWQAARTAPNEVLTAGVRASAGARIRRVSQSLVVAEIALAFVLLAVSAALIFHLRNLGRTSPGFDADHLLTFSVSLADSIASDDGARSAFQKRLADAVRTIPGVAAAGFANRLPLTGCCLSTTIYREGHPVESSAVERTSYVVADAGFFQTMRIPLRRGRFLTEADTSEDPLHVVLNQAAATRYWGRENPLDGFGRFGGADGTRFQVVGVIGDVRNNGLGNPTVPEIYILSSVAAVNPMQFVLRSSLPHDRLIPDVGRAVRSVDPALPVHDALPMNDIVRNSLSLERVGSLMTTFFALAALLMATLGVYGLVSYGVRQRTVEIGTRMALGAARRDVLTLVVGSGLRMAAVGIVLGSGATVVAVRLLARFFGLHDPGWLPLVSSTAIVAGVATTASSFPAWRAARLSPIAAVRDESESMWRSARMGVDRTLKRMSRVVARSAEPWSVPQAELLADFVVAARRAQTPAEQIQMALAALCSRLGAESARLLEKLPSGAYRSTAALPGNEADDCMLPADGFLVHRLEATASALPLTHGDIGTLARWAAENKPERLSEVDTLSRLHVRLAAGVRLKHEMLGCLLLGPPVNRFEYGAAERSALAGCAGQFALMIENGRRCRSSSRG